MSASGQNWLQAQSMFDSLEMRQIRDDQGNHFHTFSRFGQNFSNLKTPYNLQHYLQLTTLLQHFCRLDTAGLSFHTSLRSTQTYTLTLEPTDRTGDGRGDNIGATGEPCFKAPAVSTELLDGDDHGAFSARVQCFKSSSGATSHPQKTSFGIGHKHTPRAMAGHGRTTNDL